MQYPTHNLPFCSYPRCSPALLLLLLPARRSSGSSLCFPGLLFPEKRSMTSNSAACQTTACPDTKNPYVVATCHDLKMGNAFTPELEKAKVLCFVNRVRTEDGMEYNYLTFVRSGDLFCPFYLKHPLVGVRYDLFWRVLRSRGLVAAVGNDADKDVRDPAVSAPALWGALPILFRVISSTVA